MVDEIFFVSYVNNVESKIDRSDLIYTLKCHVYLICSPNNKHERAKFSNCQITLKICTGH
jgi:hypothetical protein